MDALDFEAGGFAELIHRHTRDDEPTGPHAAKPGDQNHAKQRRTHAIGIERAHRARERRDSVFHTPIEKIRGVRPLIASPTPRRARRPLTVETSRSV